MKTQGITIVQCTYCGKDVEKHTWYVKSKPNSKFYCDSKCLGYWKATKDNPLRKNRFFKCLACGKDYEVGYNQQSERKYCSISCSLSVNIAANLPRIDTRVDTKCNYCLIDLKIHKFRFNPEKGHFCSKECFNAIRRVSITCKGCGVTFISPKHTDRIYCSSACHKKNHIYNRSSYEVTITKYLISNNLEVITNGTLKLGNSYVKPDILLGYNIVEVFGDYWHCNPKFYSEDFINHKLHMTAGERWKQDATRLSSLKSLGYTVLVVWERDCIEDMPSVLVNCLNFLKGTYEISN